MTNKCFKTIKFGFLVLYLFQEGAIWYCLVQIREKPQPYIHGTLPNETGIREDSASPSIFSEEAEVLEVVFLNVVEQVVHGHTE